LAEYVKKRRRALVLKQLILAGQGDEKERRPAVKKMISAILPESLILSLPLSGLPSYYQDNSGFGFSSKDLLIDSRFSLYQYL